MEDPLGMHSDAQRARAPEARFAGLAAAWLFTHRSWNTQAAYEADLAWFAAWCAQADRAPMLVTQQDVEQYRADCEASGASPALVRRRLAALTSFFRDALNGDDVATNPAEGVERPASPPGSSTAELTDGEAQALLAAASNLGPKAAALVSVLLLDGLKVGEALAADVDDLAAPSRLTLDRQHRRQTVILHTATTAAIAAYLADRSTGPLFLGPSRGTEPSRLTRFGADYLLKRVTADAEITKPVSANTLRRHYVKSVQDRGASLDDIRARLGHYDRRTTRRLLPETP